MRCTSTRVFPEPGPASTSTLVWSRLSATMPCWTGFFRLSTISRHESGVVSRRSPVPGREASGRELLVLQREVVRRKAQSVRHGGEAALGELHHHVDLQHPAL